MNYLGCSTVPAKYGGSSVEKMAARVALLAVAAFVTFRLTVFQISAQSTPKTGLIDVPQFEANSSRGCLECHGKSAEYRIMHSDILAILTANNITETSRVLSVRVGARSSPECLAETFPKRSSTPQLYKISVDYDSCGFQQQLTSTSLVYHGTVTITIEIPLMDSSYERLIQIPLSCSGDLSPTISTSAPFIDEVINMTAIPGGFDIGITSSATSSLEPEFLNIRVESQVITLKISVDEAGRDNFHLAVARCWATPTADKNDPSKFEFIQNKGCLAFPRMVTQKSTRAFEVSYQLISFQFLDRPSNELFFHCDVYICPIEGDLDRCTIQCPSGSTRVVSARNSTDTGGPNKSVRTGVVALKNKSPFIIRPDGTPEEIEPDPDRTTTPVPRGEVTSASFLSSTFIMAGITAFNLIFIFYIYCSKVKSLEKSFRLISDPPRRARH